MYPKNIFVDQMNRSVVINQPPQRIISLVPSQTELLHYLGLGERVVGITKFCELPQEWHKNKIKVGGTKQFHFDRIAALQPDLIIGNKEENEKTQIEALAKDYPVWMSDIKTLEDALAMILSIGEIVGAATKAQTLEQEIKVAFTLLQSKQDKSPPPSVAYFIWRNPYMAAAKETFIDHLLHRAGFVNVFALKNRYPEIQAEELQAVKPDLIFLSSEPYPFKEKHIEELQRLCPQSVIKLVDGALFSWYGNRLLHAAAYFSNLHNET